MAVDKDLHEFRKHYLTCMLNKLRGIEHFSTNSYERISWISSAYNKFFNENAMNLFPDKDSSAFFEKENEVLFNLNRTDEDIKSIREYSFESAKKYSKRENFLAEF